MLTSCSAIFTTQGHNKSAFQHLGPFSSAVRQPPIMDNIFHGMQWTLIPITPWSSSETSECSAWLG